jgi:large repetitive protein
MQITTTAMSRLAAALLLAGSVTACVDSQKAPALTGPSGLSQSLSLTASPDRIAHDGQSQSIVTVAMIDENGQPISGQRVSVGATTGALSHIDVVTGSDGRAAFAVRAPALSTPAADITVVATPFGDNAETALSRSVKIALTGTQNTTAPSASFTVAPDAPTANAAVGFDASATIDEGTACFASCAYHWTFGDGQTSDGRVVTHTYSSAGTYVVGLSVTDLAGSQGGTTKVVTVAAPATPTP